MALDKLVDSTQLDGAMGSTADEIRKKTGGTSPLTWDMDTGFKVAVSEIITPTDGSIPTKTSADLIVNGKTVTAPLGYYATDASANVANGAYNATVSSHSISTVPVVTSATNGTVTDISTTAKPSGIDGTNYWTITPNASVTTTGVSTAKGKATISTAGYISTGNKESTASTVNITPTVSKGATRYIPKALSTTASGTVTVDAGTAITSVSGMVTTATDTGYSVTAIATGGNASVTASSITVGVGYNPSAITVSTTADGATGENSSTTKYIQKGVLGANVSSNTSGSASMSATGFTPLSSGTSSYYITLSTTAGSVKAKASVATEGYVKNETKETGATSVAVSGNGNKLYIPSGSVTQNAPTINSTGLVTATSTVTTGFVESDTKSNTLQLPTQGAQTITPSTTNQTIASGKYLTGTQTILGDADLVVGNIKKGVNIFGVTGTFTTTPSGKSALVAEALRVGYAGFINGSQVNGNMADTVITEGITTVSDGVATRGTWSQTSGYTGARTIDVSTFANEATSGQTYVDISNTESSPVLAQGDYLYINKGWTDNLKISLAKLVPDGSDVKGHGDYILSGHSAYDNDGTLVAGTIPTKTQADLTVNGKTVNVPYGYYATAVSKSVALGKVTSGTASITTLTKTYNTTSGKFDVSGSADVSAPVANTAGYISSTEGTRNKSTGGATVSATLNKIVATTSITGTTTKKPVILKVDTPTGVTNASSGDATTTAPSSGVYVAIKSNANTGTLTATPTVTTEGYGTADYHGITGNTATVGASASDTTYVPITETTATVSGNKVSYGTGWITGGSKSVASGAYSASVSSHTISTTPVVTGSISGTVTTIGTVTKPTGTDGTNYWTITPSGLVTTTGVSSAKGKATISTTGYISAGNKESSESAIDITPTVSNGTARYLVKASSSVSRGSASATAGKASTSVTGMVTTNTDTGYSVSASATGGSASVTNYSATVGIGYNPSEVTVSTGENSSTGQSVSQTKYIQKGILSASVSSNTSGSASMSATGFTASSSETSYYVTLSTTAGSVKAKASVGTEGYVKTETNETSATSVAVNGNGNKLYLPVCSVTTSLTVDGMSTYFDSGTSSDKNVTLTPKYINTAGYKPTVATATNNGGIAYYKIKTTTATVSGKTVSYGTGWITEGTTSVADGAYSADVSSHTNSTVTPSTGLDTSATSTYGFTTTQPSSGTTGTNYLTITPSASATQWTVTPRANIVTAGYLAVGNKTGTAVSNTPSVAAGTNYYVPVVSNSFSGGGISITTNYSKSDLAVTLGTGSETNMANITVGAKDTTNYPYYFKVNASTPAVSGKTKATRAAATYTNSAGVIAAHSSTQIWASSAVEPTVSVNATSGSTYVGLKKATTTVAGSNVVSPSASVTGSNATLGTTNNGISVTATGGGTASVTATATTNATGYAPASTQLGSATLSAPNKTTTATKYISGVTIPTPSSNSNTFTVTATSGGVSHTYTFTQSSTDRTTIKVDNIATLEWNDTDKSLDFIYNT